MLFFSREATSEIYGPWVYSLSYLLFDLLFATCIFRYIIPKTQKYLAAIVLFILFLVLSRSIHPIYYKPIYLLPERDWQPLLRVGLQVFVLCVQVSFTSCCLVLLLVRYLGFITEGNIIPSLCYMIPPSLGKYRRTSSYHQRRGQRGQSTAVKTGAGLDGPLNLEKSREKWSLEVELREEKA